MLINLVMFINFDFMKKIITSILFLAAITFAANVQILEPTGAEFSPDAPKMVQSIVRSAVAQTGNTPVEGSESIQLRTSIMTMGSTFVVVCEQLNNGTVAGSGKQKAGSIDDLDVAIEYAVQSALANLAANAPDAAAYAPAGAYQESSPEVVYVVPVEHGYGSGSGDPNDEFAHKRPTRNYVSYGLGVALWHNWEDDYNTSMDWDMGFVFHYGRIFETTPHGAITIMNNMNMSFGDEWQWHEAFLIGGRYFFSTGSVSPYAGAGIGLGLQSDEHMDTDNEFAIGLAGGLEMGLVCFRNSATQLEIGLAWDTMWDGFEAFDHRFGAGSFYIAINY